MNDATELVQLDHFVAPGESITYGVVKPGDDPVDGVRFIRGGDIKDGAIRTRELRRISHEVSRQYKRTLLRGGELLISLVGNPGEVAVVSHELAGANIARQVGLIRLRADASAEFVKYYLMSPAGRAALGAQSIGSVQVVINLSDLKRVPIPNLPLQAQRSIADALSILDAKIELNRRTNETLEAMAQAIFRDWFVDFGPVRRKQAGATNPVEIMGGLTPDPSQAAELAALFPGSLEGEGAPAGWRSFVFGELAHLNKEQVAPGRDAGAIFRHYSLPAYDAGQSPVIEEGAAILSNKFLVPPGSVLLSKLNPEIPRVWLPDDGPGEIQIASTEFLVLKPRLIERSLLYSLCRSDDLRAKLASMVTGTSKSHQRVSPASLMTQEVLVGAANVFDAFQALTHSMHERILSGREESRTLSETRDYLLPRLMSGAVRIGDIADSPTTHALEPA